MPQGFAPWSFDPIAPFGVPAVISKAFWGGLWGMLISLILAGRTGVTYWLGWTILGAVALPLVAIFVVPVVKGLPVPPFSERFPIYALVNAAWGLGAAVFLRLFGALGR
jgi:flagellar biosynthesis protein FliR